MPEPPQTCSVCGTTREAVEFYRRTPTRRMIRCIPCVRQREQARRGNGVGKDQKLRREYGITLREYYQMMIDQNEVCVICHGPETRLDRRTGKVQELAVDHCHKTGRVRALLCNRCNILVGYMEKSAEKTWAALTYLIEQELSQLPGNNEATKAKYGKGLVKDA